MLERADSVGSAWRGRYNSLRLHTARWLSNLPGHRSRARSLEDYVRATGVNGTPYREPSPYGGQRVLVVGAGNSATEIANELTRVAAEVQLSVRNPPNIVRRDTFGVPSQLIGVALHRAPEAVMNPLTGLLRRLTVPDLTAYGLPAPSGDGFTQFLRSKTVPILDHGFVEAVRTGRITIVPAISAIDGPEVRLVDGALLRPDAIVAATGYRPDLDRLIGGLPVLDASGYPLVHGARTSPAAPDLYFVGLTVQLSGLLHEISREAQQVARRIGNGVG